jgi:hypothetical protein
MSTVEIVAIIVASVVVVLLIVAFVATRRRGRAPDQSPELPVPADAQTTPPEQSGSFLDEPLTDTLGKLGRAEHEPHAVEAGSAEAATPDSERDQPTREIAIPQPDPLAPPPEGPPLAAPEPAAKAATPEAAAPPPKGAAPRRVPLSDIIVTTSDKVVDLGDAEVRHMLTDLVTFEIDQATLYRQQGQSIDAVLQLTEAEKICKALGMADTAERIRTMMDELNL